MPTLAKTRVSNLKSTERRFVRLQLHQDNQAMQIRVCEVPTIIASLVLLIITKMSLFSSWRIRMCPVEVFPKLYRSDRPDSNQWTFYVDACQACQICRI